MYLLMSAMQLALRRLSDAATTVGCESSTATDTVSQRNELSEQVHLRHDSRCTLTIPYLFGGPISVDSKKFDDPGDSTPYNEYMALYYCSRRAMWTRNIIREINYYNESLIYYMIQHATILYGDNDTATARARERKMTMNDRHVALKYHTIRDWVAKGQLEARRVASEDNGSDLGTKAVSGPIMGNLYLPMKGYGQIYLDDELRAHLSDPEYYVTAAL